MRGTVQKKGTRWYAVVYDGIDPGTGRKRRRWLPAGTRRSDAERLLNEAIRRKYQGEPVPTERLTLGDYLVDRWLPIQKARVRPPTYDGQPPDHRPPRPAPGWPPLDRLTIEDVDLLYAALLTKGRIRRSGPPALSPKSVRNIHVMLTADLVTVPGMGHALSPAIVSPLAEAILAHTSSVGAGTS